MALRLPKILPQVRFWLGIGIGSVWVFHGLYSKILHGVPRHQLIVARVLGEQWSAPATLVIGVGEVLLGLWIFRGRARVLCAVAQTAILITMNALEITLAGDLLISAPGMAALNALLLALVWWWAVGPAKSERNQSQPA